MTKRKAIDTECMHHWQLSPPSGELTNGTCKKCGAEKQFTGESRIGNSGRTTPKAPIPKTK
jgi:hypothetical protein